MQLYDYIYVDLEKVVSLYSQLTGGVVEVREKRSQAGISQDNKRHYDFKVFKHDAGSVTQDIEQDKSTIKPHHALLQELEEKLASSGHMLDLNDLKDGETLKTQDIRDKLKKVLCIKVSGRIVVEDYERVTKIGQDFPDIIKLINCAQNEALKESEEYQHIIEQIDQLENAKTKDRNQRSINKIKAKKLREQLKQHTQITSVEGVPQWLIDGLRTWVDTFLPNITNIRVYPFQEEVDEHVFGHLESTNFDIGDSTAFHFTHGSFPTENYTLLGIVTSVPSKEGDNFDPTLEFEKSDLADYESVENGFRGLFRGFNGFEKMIRTSRFPRVLVHPLLVYREGSSFK